MKLVRFSSLFAAIAALLVLALPAGAAAPRNSGFYDHQIIEYVSSQEITSSPHAAQSGTKRTHLRTARYAE